MKRLILFCLAIIPMVLMAQQASTLTPDKIYGDLFIQVQLQRIFPDGKTFVDCTPKRKVADIMYDYGLAKGPNFNLKKFVADNFDMPVIPTINYTSDTKQDLATHIKSLWQVLKRNPDVAVEGSSLLPLSYPYIVPGGRFREIYYWDSYFTMLGLKESNEWEMIENMINNFAFLINTYGHIPNGNRSYYLSRSQPPFFAMMVNLLADKKGASVYATYQKELQKEYDYWMDKTAATKHAVTMPDGSILNRYYDADIKPRQESFKEDFEIATTESRGDAAAFEKKSKELRSGAESGWDFSSRWFADGESINTIQTTNSIPVDLNGLMLNLELTLAKAYRQTGNISAAMEYTNAAAKRKAAINKYCFNTKQSWYYDYIISTKKQSTEQTIAGVSPLFFNIASKKQSAAIAAVLKAKFLKSGGVVSTLKTTGQQWDAPNGWAPLQWIAVKGLDNYGLKNQAKDIAARWVALNEKVYTNTGKMMEKYNVVDSKLDAGGGEYKSQDGFGWTNGVYLAMKAKLQEWKKTETMPRKTLKKGILQ
ncbi:alpha,alpha-trehalase TreF [Ferruginibacter sp.]|uniref:alpha,alpha-trehalase TreF n=1 Tax=Ferruginibacter sp. TaxID=1940288 RepID=UPI0019B28C13|nr:alpha,alpha-trehalase TreF [Ferruginibacter sp.]MBC7628214.1 alpha,alpha-trehalase TreF [Ferruginibacter sp.]